MRRVTSEPADDAVLLALAASAAPAAPWRRTTSWTRRRPRSKAATGAGAPWDGPTTGPKAQPGKIVIYRAGDQRNGGAHGVGDGAEEAAKAIGWDFRAPRRPGHRRPALSAMTQAIALQPDGIISRRLRPRAEQAPSVEQAVKQGIKVVGWHGGPTPGPDRGHARCSPTSPPTRSKVAEASGLYAVVDSGGKAGVIVFTDSPTRSPSRRRRAWRRRSRSAPAARCSRSSTRRSATSQNRMGQLTTSLLQRTATSGPTRSASTTSTTTSGRPRCSAAGIDPPKASRTTSPPATARVRLSAHPRRPVPGRDRRRAAHLQGWQIVDELNRAFAGEQPRGYVAPPHLFVQANIDVDGGDKNIFDPGNGYRDEYKKIWGPVARRARGGRSASRRVLRPRTSAIHARALSPSLIRRLGHGGPADTPTYAHNMRAIGHSDQGGRPDAVQVMVNKGHAYVSHLFSNGFSVIDVRDPKNPKAVGYFPAPTTPGTCTARPTTTCCSSCTPRTCGRSPSSPTSGTTTRAKNVHGSPRPRASATGPPAWPSTTSPSPPSRGRSASCRSTAAASIASGTSAAAGPMPRR